MIPALDQFNPIGSRVPFRCKDADLRDLKSPYSEQVDKAIRERGSALLYGPTGVGKTFAMIAALRYFHSTIPTNSRGPDIMLDSERGIGCAFIDWPEFVVRIFRDKFAPGGVLGWRGPLFVDDVGQEHFVHSGYRAGEAEQLFSLFVNRRTGLNLPLWITSNLTPAEIGERYGERTISRLSEHCSFIKFDGADRRLTA